MLDFYFLSLVAPTIIRLCLHFAKESSGLAVGVLVLAFGTAARQHHALVGPQLLIELLGLICCRLFIHVLILVFLVHLLELTATALLGGRVIKLRGRHAQQRGLRARLVDDLLQKGQLSTRINTTKRYTLAFLPLENMPEPWKRPGVATGHCPAPPWPPRAASADWRAPERSTPPQQVSARRRNETFDRACARAKEGIN